MLTPDDRALSDEFLNQPINFGFRYTSAADRHLREILFRSLARNRNDYLCLFFPHGTPDDRSWPWSLKEAQGAEEGAEYTAAAKGTACGHIFKTGESTYHCKTCAADDTCVLCVRCFESSDHEGHNVFISVSPGNAGCCDCNDREAWRGEVPCSIHTDGTVEQPARQTGKQRASMNFPVSQLPPDLVEAMRMTLGRAIDYLCDIFSCSPEQLRLVKSEASIREDEEQSRLGPPYEHEPTDPNPEFALVLWNDEKHTVDDVQNQVARACSKSKRFGKAIAHEVDEFGRSVVHYSRDVQELLRMASILEQIKVTVTIRSSRDTFREQMCSTIIDWISDISGCAVGGDLYVLRNLVCEELLKRWRTGSRATNVDIGRQGMDDHESEENNSSRRQYREFMQTFAAAQTDVAAGAVPAPLVAAGVRVVRMELLDGNTVVDANDDGIDEDEDDADDYDEIVVEEDSMEVETEERQHPYNAAIDGRADTTDMDIDFMDDTEALEATLAGYPPPPPPPRNRPARRRIFTPADSDDGEAVADPRPNIRAPYNFMPKTPKAQGGPNRRLLRPSKHWLEKPGGFQTRMSEPCEDLWQRVRLDYLILYDLRLWKILRIRLRHLYITTVVTTPNFKRILGLRFAGLYTNLAQLYLIADREPDHSIINLSLQMLTTPSITEEVVERGNFFTNLMALLYTFLTTRQVGYPEDVNPRATLAFDAGAVTNRRIFHFFMDLRWLCQSEFIRHRIRIEPQYLLQFLDLVKLHQGVCPNTRATGEHVEYESDAWISASMIVKELNRLCKQVAESFASQPETIGWNRLLMRALRTSAQVTMINSFGYERRRFTAAELKEDLPWHVVGPFEAGGKQYSVPKCVVQTEPMSFHHPLHYLLSWLIEDAKAMKRSEVRALLAFTPSDLKDPWNVTRAAPAPPSSLTPDELLSSIFDHPLRTYVWLAQMKSGMWVRNGITLRHQAHTYRSVNYRDVGYQRDILMVQAGLVLCGSDTERPGERFLAQMIDRFELTRWFTGDYAVMSGYEEIQQLDVIEDFFHLLVIVLCERSNLTPAATEKEQHARTVRNDIAHALCFKPLSYSDIKARVTDKVSDSDEFAGVLESIAVYRPPEGLSDTGTFQLKRDAIELVDPYYAHYSRNHREEAEGIYKKHIGLKTGKKAEDVVYEPHLEAIPSGLFVDLAAFTRTPLFVQTLCTALAYAAGIKSFAPKMQVTRVETFLHMVLHLVIIAVIEDSVQGREEGFMGLAATPVSRLDGRQGDTVVSLLVRLSGIDEYASCHPTIKHVLRRMQRRSPDHLSTLSGLLGALFDRTETGSPASVASTEDKDKKKQEALARQARVMAKMKEQQNSFMQNQGMSAFGDDFDDFDNMSITEEPEGFVETRKTWKFPSGTCILCQEDTDDQKLYGTFAYLGESNVLRATPVEFPAFVQEVLDTPISLDRAADAIRPFGVSGDNKRTGQRTMADGKVVNFERQGLSQGFPTHQPQNTIRGPVSTSCGHIMHFHCFERYLHATAQRHQNQIARNHPERIGLKEFTCPLCKALGNTFLPIIWRGKECACEHELHAAKELGEWLAEQSAATAPDLSFTKDAATATQRLQQVQELYASRSSRYVAATFAPSLISSLQELSLDPSSAGSGVGSASQQPRFSLRRGYSLSSLFRIGRGEGAGVAAEARDQYLASSSSASSSSEQPRMAELVRAYHRIDETIRVNKLFGSASPHRSSAEGAVNPVAALSRALGMSVSAFEIAHRGAATASEPLATSLLADLSEQNLTHLRILSETVESFLAVNVLRNPGVNMVAQDTVKRRDIMCALLFGMESDIAFIKLKDSGEKLLFQDDVFLFFVDWLAFMAPNVAEANSILQLCYWAEVVKAVFVFKRLVKWMKVDDTAGGVPVSEAFKLAVSGMAMEWDRYAMPLSDAELQAMRVVVDKYALAFLRKSIVLMHVRYGLDFECPYNIDVEAPELQRLTSLLHLPALDQICTLYTTQGTGSDRLRQITKRWISQATMITEHESAAETSISLAHPAILELVGLPLHYDTLTEEALKRRCPTTGKELTDPALCLFCGAIFCSQAVCCMKDKNQGGCTQHLRSCGGKIGVFINIRKCMVLLLHEPGNGSWAYAPYLDKHGEPDPTLRKHHQLFLHGRRYDKLVREVWLQGQVGNVIARKLEADVNPGGWETL
ncbi:E3 ubiquitin-protein ligase ubr1 [Friedmanniomyces endolithicus]|nr:E3 ubiquitin-protein ligase ubr1 [Friedmanniomyces endolithicus]